jgi:hypothetical protein
MKRKLSSVCISVLMGVFLSVSLSTVYADGKEEHDDHYDTTNLKNPNIATFSVFDQISNDKKPRLSAEQDSNKAWILYEKKDSVFEDYQDKRASESGKVTSLTKRKSSVTQLRPLGPLHVLLANATKERIDSALQHADSLILDSTRIVNSYGISSLWLITTPQKIREGIIYLPKTQTVKDSSICKKEKPKPSILRIAVAVVIIFLLICLCVSLRGKKPEEETVSSKKSRC